jgi:hypothetical protein
MKQLSRMKTITALLLSLSLVAAGFAPSSTTATTNAVAPPEHPEVAEGAKQFDEAVRDIEGILTLDLTSEKGAKQAAAIIEKNAKKLAHVEKKAIHAAMRVTSFERGLKAEAAKRKGGAEELAKELEANPGSVANIAGADEAARAIRESIQPAAEKLKKVSDALLKAAEKTKISARLTSFEFQQASYSAPGITTVEGLTSSSSTSFCGSYKYICDVLAYLGAWYLWGQMRVITYPSRVSSCIVSSYQRWRDGCRNVGFYDDGLVLSLVGCNGWFLYRVNYCVQQLF